MEFKFYNLNIYELEFVCVKNYLIIFIMVSREYLKYKMVKWFLKLFGIGLFKYNYIIENVLFLS